MINSLRSAALAAAVCAAIVGGACKADSDSRAAAGRDTARADGAAPRATGTAAAGSRAPGQAASADPRLARADSARIQGRADARLWIVEVSDFQCPYCSQWHAETYPAIKREYVDAGKVRFAYVNLPLDNHANAGPAAEAAMCAGEQGKFWEMHDAIFEAQTRWAPLPDPAPLFATLASGVGVDAGRLRECLSSGVMRPLVQADRDRAIAAGVNSTPSFLIGGARIAGAVPLAAFRRLIDSVLAATPAPAGRP